MSMRFAESSAAKKETPVKLPPGLLRLDTKPNATGSKPLVKTIGILAVAALADYALTIPPVATINDTPRRTSSSASAGSRAY
jgi:hypothetical protein